MKKMPQPPIDRLGRDTERHSFWPACVVACAGLICLLWGLSRQTRAETTNGANATETQLMKAFASAGIQTAPSSAAPTFPSGPGTPGFDPARPPEAVPPNVTAKAGRFKLRVNTESNAACPT
jgi:hypothetical protein